MNAKSEKKHFSQMTENERKTIMNFAKKIPKTEWDFSPYTKKRIEERGGTVETILNTLQNGELIEYHLKDKKSRILLRGTHLVNEHHYFVPCAVFELKTKKIITVYWNHVDDNHRTLNLKPYNEEMNVIAEFLKND